MINVELGRVPATHLDGILQGSVRHIDAAFPGEKFLVMNSFPDQVLEVVRSMNGLGWPIGIHLIELLI